VPCDSGTVLLVLFGRQADILTGVSVRLPLFDQSLQSSGMNESDSSKSRPFLSAVRLFDDVDLILAALCAASGLHKVLQVPLISDFAQMPRISGELNASDIGIGCVRQGLRDC
jgi:hypothetical protein